MPAGAVPGEPDGWVAVGLAGAWVKVGVALGKGVTRVRVGDEVYGDLSRWGSRGWGGFAEYVVAPRAYLYPIPAAMSFLSASMVEPLATSTNFFDHHVHGPVETAAVFVWLPAGVAAGTV